MCYCSCIYLYLIDVTVLPHIKTRDAHGVEILPYGRGGSVVW